MAVALETFQDYIPKHELKEVEKADLPPTDDDAIRSSKEAENMKFKELLNKLARDIGERRPRGYISDIPRKFLLQKGTTPIRSYERRYEGWYLDTLTVEPTNGQGLRDKWQHSINIDAANRYMLQLCIDYIRLFQWDEARVDPKQPNEALEFFNFDAEGLFVDLEEEEEELLQMPIDGRPHPGEKDGERKEGDEDSLPTYSSPIPHYKRRAQRDMVRYLAEQSHPMSPANSNPTGGTKDKEVEDIRRTPASVVVGFNI
ncbi:hypothetical protein NPX13_g8539 [Xylaria arbuscula]|uniref:Uncharacterized protein n=1 Tax=Xylaria arbuscula TaxID=114810 RepID=A0A9W8TJC1_9PEZI|nr:hypothetical protein NPX13_g8539 [Xylaria arbuscula]